MKFDRNISANDCVKKAWKNFHVSDLLHIHVKSETVNNTQTLQIPLIQTSSEFRIPFDHNLDIVLCQIAENNQAIVVSDHNPSYIKNDKINEDFTGKW